LEPDDEDELRPSIEMNRIPFATYDFFGYLASGFLLVIGMELTLGFPRVLGQQLGPIDVVALLLAVYVAGQLVATPSKAVLEDGLVEKVLGRPNVNLFRRKRPPLRGILFPGFYKPLPPVVQERILRRVKNEGNPSTGETLFLHVRYSTEVRADEKLQARLDTFLNLYGFARNLAFASLVLSAALGARLWLLGIDPTLVKYAVTAFVVGVLLLYRYLKFFRQYSYELFNAYAANK
jgi:hypothetical protein